MSELSGKAVVITGAGRGLGRAFALAASAAGARVVINDVDASVDEVVEAIAAAGGQAVAHVGSVTSWEIAESLIATCVDTFGSIDGLVNNAGIRYEASTLEETEEAMRRIVEVNVLGTMFAGVHAVRAMAKRGGGSLVNVTSEGMLGFAGTAAYAATKAAVAALTVSWSHDRAQTGVRVNAIAPNAQTRLTPRGANGRALPRADADTIAPLVVYLLSDRSAEIDGAILKFNGSVLAPIASAEVLDGVTRATWDVATIDEAMTQSLREELERVTPPAVYIHR